MKSKTAISKAKKDLNNLLNPIKMAVRPGPNNVQYMNKFQAKEVYKPRDLNEGNQKTQESLFGEKRSIDPFKRLGINPLHEYKNSRILSEYVTEMGRIKPKYMTKLSAKSQRKVAKAIRRARAFGKYSNLFIPSNRT
ncbi:hypothetical protein H4219_001832 [Mycoemilia scoparia]|uniref:Small ribosomal subunit protein bS18m n=1 Tax=Mycoemilia scoparia TaxID=417184 RepID=A0A9W8DRE6_9FUNG|nr:hypothetical protein H4219_001832 [Mycoemilia scoparia]